MPRLEFNGKDKEPIKTRFISGISGVLKKNPFADNLIKEAQKNGKTMNYSGCYTMASNYLKTFDNLETPNPEIKKLLTDIEHFMSLSNDINAIINPDISANERDELLTEALKKIEILNNREPSFGDRVKSFMKNTKGVFSGDDGMRMLNSMAQLMNSVSMFYDIAEKEVALADWKVEVDDVYKLEQKFYKDIDSYSKECINLEVNPAQMVPQIMIGQNNQKIEELNNELKPLEGKEDDKQHSDEYNECSKRVTKYEDDLQALFKEGEEISKTKSALNNLKDRRSEQKIAYNKAMRLANNIKYNLEKTKKELETLDKKIETLEGQNKEYNEAQSYISSMSHFQKDQIDIMNTYVRENEVLNGALSGIRLISKDHPLLHSKARDISEPYRLYSSGEKKLSDLNPEDATVIESYLLIKQKMLKANPGWQDDFEAYEANLANKIPGDFEKVLGEKIKTKIKDNQDVIDLVENDPAYKKYIQMQDKVIKGMANSETLQFNKELREKKLKSIKRSETDIKNEERKMQDIEKYTRNVLGEKCPENFSDSEGVDIAIFNAQEELKQREKDGLKRVNEIQTNMIKDKNTLKKLNEGSFSFKRGQIKLQVESLTQKNNRINNLAKTKGDIAGKLTEYAIKANEIKHKNKDVKSPYDRITERLEHIRDHFNDVQSFWSKGMSKSCKDMYDQLEATISILRNADANTQAKLDAIKSLSSRSTDYVGAKNAQNIPKSFASDQRFWRLSFAEEMINMKGAADAAIRSKASNASTLEAFNEFMNKDYKNIPENATKIINEAATKQINKLSQKNDLENEVNRVKTGENITQSNLNLGSI